MRDKTKYYPNTYQTPNVLIDEHLKDLDPIEFTLLSIIIRKTMGWGKECDFISLSQIMQYAQKISRPSIIRKMASLENVHKLIITIRSKGRTNEYRLSDIFFNKVVSQGHQSKTEVVSQGYQTGITEIPVEPESSITVIHTKPNSIKPTNKTQKERSPKNGLRDVQLYFIQEGIEEPLANALKFFSHYEANGWVQGRGKPLRNWRAAPWASWNFLRTYNKLRVRLIDQDGITDINEYSREDILRGLNSGKLRIENDLFFICSYEREIKTSIPLIENNENIKNNIKASLQIQ